MVSDEDDPRAAGRAIPGWSIVAALMLLFLAVALYFALGMPGMDHGDPPAGAGHSGMVRGLPAGAFAARAADPDAFVINVHEPYAGEIAGTDGFSAADRLRDAALPDDKTSPILVYCLTGAMSGDAADALMELGYTDVVTLDGGMRAWEASGRAVIDRRK